MMIAADEIRIYARGLACVSVCAAADFSPAFVEADVNRQYPSGVGPWFISKDTHFKGGESNPCVCHDDACRLHYLLNC